MDSTASSTFPYSLSLPSCRTGFESARVRRGAAHSNFRPAKTSVRDSRDQHGGTLRRHRGARVLVPVAHGKLRTRLQQIAHSAVRGSANGSAQCVATRLDLPSRLCTLHCSCCKVAHRSTREPHRNRHCCPLSPTRARQLTLYSRILSSESRRRINCHCAALRLHAKEACRRRVRSGCTHLDDALEQLARRTPRGRENHDLVVAVVAVASAALEACKGRGQSVVTVDTSAPRSRRKVRAPRRRWRCCARRGPSKPGGRVLRRLGEGRSSLCGVPECFAESARRTAHDAIVGTVRVGVGAWVRCAALDAAPDQHLRGRAFPAVVPARKRALVGEMAASTQRSEVRTS